MRRVLSVLLFLAVMPGMAIAQIRRPAAPAKTPTPTVTQQGATADSGLAMERTAEWFARELPSLAHYAYDEWRAYGSWYYRGPYVFDHAKPRFFRMASKHYHARVDSASVNQCTLRLHLTHGYVEVQHDGTSSSEASRSVLRVPLGLVDVRGLEVVFYEGTGEVIEDPYDGSPSGTRIGSAPQVVIALHAKAGKTILHEFFHSDASARSETDWALIPVRDPESGTRVIDAIKRAAALCGARAGVL